MALSSLPPGFRFHPTDVELAVYYLKRKVMGRPLQPGIISEIDLYKFSPWDLSEKSCLESKDLVWYFFCPQDRKLTRGTRMKRLTDMGFWKITGKEKIIHHDSRVIGFRKTLVFYIGRQPEEERTNWVMHEIRLKDRELGPSAYVLCKIFQKSGLGPKIGEHHGAPYREEDWEDDVINDRDISIPYMPCLSSRPLDDRSAMLSPVLKQPVPSEFVESVPVEDNIGAFEDQMIIDPDDSMKISANAEGRSDSVNCTQNVCDEKLVWTMEDSIDIEDSLGQMYEDTNIPMDVTENALGEHEHKEELSWTIEASVDIENPLDQMIEDPNVTMDVTENANYGKSTAVNCDCTQLAYNEKLVWIIEGYIDFEDFFNQMIEEHNDSMDVTKNANGKIVPYETANGEYVQGHDLQVEPLLSSPLLSHYPSQAEIEVKMDDLSYVNCQEEANSRLGNSHFSEVEKPEYLTFNQNMAQGSSNVGSDTLDADDWKNVLIDSDI